jgi:bacterioferritin
MATKKLLDMMNKAIAREMQVSIQYMWQHVLWRGIEAFAVKDEFRRIAIVDQT